MSRYQSMGEVAESRRGFAEEYLWSLRGYLVICRLEIKLAMITIITANCDLDNEIDWKVICGAISTC